MAHDSWPHESWVKLDGQSTQSGRSFRIYQSVKLKVTESSIRDEIRIREHLGFDFLKPPFLILLDRPV